MVPRDLHGASRSCHELETRLDPAIYPGRNMLRLDSPVPCKPQDTWNPALDVFLESYPSSSIWIVNQSVGTPALPHRRPARHDDQVRVLEPARHAVEVVEPRRHADDALPALHLQRDPLHR